MLDLADEAFLLDLAAEACMVARIKALEAGGARRLLQKEREAGGAKQQSCGV